MGVSDSVSCTNWRRRDQAEAFGVGWGPRDVSTKMRRRMKSPNRIDGLASIRAHVEAEYRNRTPASKRLFDEAVKFLPGGDTRAAAFFPRIRL